MYLRYGSYTHDAFEARVVITREALRNASDVHYANRERWDISGMLLASDQSGVSTAITNLEAAYATGGYDLELLLPDGVTASSHRLLTANCRGGTRIVQPVSFPDGAGGEYSTFRTYSLSVEGEIPISSSQNAITEWRETIAITGTGGPRFIPIECRNGPVQMQTVSQQTPVRAVQRGQAIGYLQYPFAPGPIWPSYELVTERQIEFEAPQLKGSGTSRSYQDYGISWSYSFVAPGPLNGLPHPQP